MIYLINSMVLRKVKDMKHTKRILAVMVCAVFAIICIMGLYTTKSYAVSETSRTNYTIKKGVTESTVYITDSEGVNLRSHILRVQSGSGATFKATVNGYYSKGSTKASRTKKAKNWKKKDWGFKVLKGLASDYNNSKSVTGTVIAASNGDFYDKESYNPLGLLIAEGHTLHKSDAEAFFAVLKDGSAVIRPAGGATSDVKEAIGGSYVLVSDGSNCFSAPGGEREPRQGIGVCADGTVVIINVDGREPASTGATMHDFAELFIQQGCTDAINFDGGGSATFLTKRQGDKSLVYRNTKGDGFERKVSSSLLVVSDSAKGTLSGSAKVSMKNSKTVLKKISGVWTYKINGKAASGFYAINGKSYLFGKNGKGLSKKIKIGNVTYTFKNGAMTKCSDKKAGRVVIGYCGAASNEQNLIYAYQYGNKVLNVGLNPLAAKKNGKMKSWSDDKRLQLPWYSMRSDILKVYIGDGVTSIGERFLFVATGSVFDGTPVPKSKLTTVRFPSSLKTIETLAFYNKPALKNVTIPAKVTSIGAYAFQYAGKGILQFKGTKVPSFGKKAIANTKFTSVKVKSNSAWKKFVKAKKFIKIGFKKTVKFF